MENKKYKSLKTRIIQGMLIGALITSSLAVIIMYYTFSKAVRKTAVEVASFGSRQVIQSIDTTLLQLDTVIGLLIQDRDIVDSLRRAEQLPADSEERASYEMQMGFLLNRYQSAYPNYQNCPIMIETVGQNGRENIYHSVMDRPDALSGFLNNEGYHAFKNQYGSYASVFFDAGDILPNRVANLSGAEIYAYCRRCRIGGQDCVVSAFALGNAITKLLEAGSRNGDYILFDRYLQVVSKSDGVEQNYSGLLSRMRSEGLAEAEYGGKTVLLEGTEYGNWYLLRIVSDNELLEGFVPYFRLNAVFLVVQGAALIGVFVLMIRKRLRPLRSLAQNMAAVSRGDFGPQKRITTGDEIEFLDDTFDAMRASLQEHIDLLLIRENEKNEALYRLMVSQLNPHFIYNTLYTINILALNRRNADVAKVNNALIDILRNMLKINVGHTMDTIANEVSLGKKYALIQQYRYPESFEVEWEIDEGMETLLIPKNLIQPLLENALFHGLMGGKTADGEITGGFISICLHRKGEYIQLRVTDDGIGMPESVIREFFDYDDTALPDMHLTLRNIKYRCRYLYKEHVLFDIHSESGMGTSFSVMFPAET